jgi:hypothetical protein
MDFFSPQQTKILLSLAKYKYLTISQFLSLEVGKDKEFIRKNLSLLREKRLTDRMTFGLIPAKGKFEDIHFLTERGAKEILSNTDLQPDQVRHPSRASTFFKNDYLHRVSTVDIMIAFNVWADGQGYQVDFFDTYFDKVGSQKASKQGIQSKTRFDLPNGQNISPDGIIKYSTANNSFLYCLEVYNGKDTKRVTEQIRKLAYATFEGIPSEKYGHDKANRNLIVFQYDTYKQTAIERIKQDPYLSQFDGLERFFLFNSVDSAKKNFGQSWSDLDGNLIDLVSL